MKYKDIALAYLARILLWMPLPIFNKWGVSITTRILAKCVVDSVNNYYEAMNRMNTGELKDNPLWIISCGLSAILALMPVAMIYEYVRDASEKTGW